MTLLSLPPASVETIRAFTTLSTPKGAPHSQRRQRFQVQPRAWRVTYDRLTKAQKETLEALYEETKAAGVFQFVPLGEVTPIDCVFGKPVVSVKASIPGRYNAECEILAFRPHE